MFRAQLSARLSGRRSLAISTVLLIVLFVVVLLRLLMLFSPKPVIAGQIYRSAQPAGEELERAARRLGLASVLSLRGPSPGKEWYREELAASRLSGLEQRDLHFVTDDWPAQKETRELVRFIDACPKPLLIHCKSGHDRSGWASAVARVLAGEPLEEALRELSGAHGHFCSPAECYLHRFFERYESWLIAEGLEAGGPNFRRWVLQVYCPPPYAAALEIVSSPEQPEFEPAEWLSFRVQVTNLSAESWLISSDQSSGIRLGVRSIGPLTEPLDEPLALFRVTSEHPRDLARAGLWEDRIGPGETRIFDIGFSAPSSPGLHYLQFDMVDELVHWFSDLGGPGILLPLIVREAPVEPVEPRAGEE